MSKDQKQTIKIPVETVDNWYQMINYVRTSLSFWHKDNEWPINLCCDVLYEIIKEIYKLRNPNNEEAPF